MAWAVERYQCILCETYVEREINTLLLGGAADQQLADLQGAEWEIALINLCIPKHPHPRVLSLAALGEAAAGKAARRELDTPEMVRALSCHTRLALAAALWDYMTSS